LEELSRALHGSDLANILGGDLASEGIKLGILEGVVPEASVPVMQDVLDQSVEHCLSVLIDV